MLLPTLLVTALLCCVNAERNLKAEAQAFVSKFRGINETTDILASLERIGDDVRELFKLGRPIGKLLRTFNATGKATPDETRALAELHKLFDHTYEHEPHDYTPYVHVVRHFGSMMEPIREYLATLTNATARGQDHNKYLVGFVKVMRLQKTTLANFNPLAILDDIDGQTRLGCQIPSAQAMQIEGRLQEAMWRVLSSARATWNESDFHRLEDAKQRLFYTLSSEKQEGLAANLIKKLGELHSASLENVMNVLDASHLELAEAEYTPAMCVMEYTADASHFNQTAVLQRLKLLHKDLIRVQLLEWALSSFTELDDEYYNKDAEITALLIERTAHFMAKWTRTAQKVSWPVIGIEFARRAIGLSSISIEAYNETAKKVQKAFEDHGSPSYSYQVLVAPTSEVDVSWSVGSKKMDDYANITAFNGLDVHVFRYNKTEIGERSAIAKKWVKNNVQGLKKQIGLGAFSSTSSMLSILQTESSIGPIYSDDLFRSVVLMNKVTVSPAKPDMPIGFALSEDASYNLDVMRTSYSVLGHGKETIYAWKAFFFA